MLLAVGVLSLPVLSSHAEVIDIVWRTEGRFDRHLTVLPGESAELCGALILGQTVNWSFDADGALSFNIHYRAGKEVRYPRTAAHCCRELTDHYCVNKVNIL